VNASRPPAEAPTPTIANERPPVLGGPKVSVEVVLEVYERPLDTRLRLPTLPLVAESTRVFRASVALGGEDFLDRILFSSEPLIGVLVS
jgi:hypothetical protein